MYEISAIAYDNLGRNQMENRESYWDYMLRRTKEKEERDQPIWQQDIAQLTESYYSALKRIKDLVEENNILRKRVNEMSNSKQMELKL